jgi:hypothetical protein
MRIVGIVFGFMLFSIGAACAQANDGASPVKDRGTTSSTDHPADHQKKKTGESSRSAQVRDPTRPPIGPATTQGLARDAITNMGSH